MQNPFSQSMFRRHIVVKMSTIKELDDCLSLNSKPQQWGLREECATRVGLTEYKVNEGVSIRSHLVTLTNDRRDQIRTTVLTQPGTRVGLRDRTLVSRKAFVEEHRYCRKLWPYNGRTTYEKRFNGISFSYENAEYTVGKETYSVFSHVSADLSCYR